VIIQKDKNYISIVESRGIGVILDRIPDLNVAIERITRYFVVNFNSTGNISDLPRQFHLGSKFQVNELKPLNFQPEFIRSNGYDFVYIIEIKWDIDLSQFIDEWTKNRIN
jgi:hypothetical protein